MTNRFSLDFEMISILEFPKNKINYLSKISNNLILVSLVTVFGIIVVLLSLQ
jgi:hypothetical protein